ncbi:hypothetical protein L3Q82_006682 [Scortum barcoo]|uniref:Uncharacterized protein n=1 Tax=Scortum barcoo TaxID=214431 RepID=A0ACB8WVS2_9TELE|nr:hypothetical protein L3Q82_006682 [Scortum barcoo]
MPVTSQSNLTQPDLTGHFTGDGPQRPAIMPQPRMMLVVTGDDFGYCPRRNQGIVDCFQAGGISNVSLLVNASAAKEAADLAKRLVVMPAVYVPPDVDTNKAMDKLYGLIDSTETSRLEAAFILAEDFNNASLRNVLQRYHQHIKCPTHGENTLDHVYTPYMDKALPRPPFGKSDHASVLLLPS